MLLDLTPREVLTTTRSVRRRLDLNRDVPRAVLEECLRDAIQAPTASNRQTWHFVFVRDPEKKAELARLYIDGDDRRTEVRREADRPSADPRALRRAAIIESDRHLREHLHRVPWMLVPCQEGRVEHLSMPEQGSWWASIVPAVWSFMLAARLRGIGTTWLTGHLVHEREAAQILGVSHQDVTQIALVPIAYTIGIEFRLASRLPVEHVSHWDAW